MRRLPWVLAILLVLAIVGFAAAGWADKNSQPQRDRLSWDNQWEKPSGNQPPGWDQGKKTGWRDQDLPPGQEKKTHRRSPKKHRHHDNDWRRSHPRPDSTPVPVPIPVPTPR